MTTPETPLAHSDKIGGSTAERSINCPAWVNLSKGIHKETSAFANKGSALHSCMELYLNDDSGMALERFIGFEAFGYVVTATDITEKLSPCVEFLQWVSDTYGPYDFEVESEVSMGDALPGCFGSCDLIIRPDNHPVVLVADWKFGDGKVVHAENNAQGKFYALAASLDVHTSDLFMGADDVVVCIVQPTARRPDGQSAWSTWQFDVAELFPFLLTLQNALAAIDSKHPAMSRGGWCTFCPAKPVCKEWVGAAKAIPLDENIEMASGARLAELLELADNVDGWCSALRKFAENEMNRGVDIEGWKIVQKQARRTWINEVLALKRLRGMRLKVKDITDSKLLSPAKIEKLVDKNKWAKVEPELVRKKSSGTTLATAGDKRPDVRMANALAKATATT